MSIRDVVGGKHELWALAVNVINSVHRSELARRCNTSRRTLYNITSAINSDYCRVNTNLLVRVIEVGIAMKLQMAQNEKHRAIQAARSAEESAAALEAPLRVLAPFVPFNDRTQSEEHAQ